MATIDMVFEGGGAKGVALSGAVAAIFARGHRLGRVVGTSAGAITATNLSVGYHPEEVLASSKTRTPDGKPIYSTFDDPPMLTTDEIKASGLFRELVAHSATWAAGFDAAVIHALMKVPGFASLFSLVERGGLHRGDAFVTWMRGCLDGGDRNYGALDYKTLHDRTKVDLSVVVTDTTERRMLVLNHRTAPSVPVVWGTRMSMSIPFYWDEVVWRPEWGTYMGRDISGHVIVDGGVTSNFPLRLMVDADDDEVRGWMGAPPASRNKVVGLYLDAGLDVPGQPAPPRNDHVSCRVSALLDTMMSASDNTVFETHADRIIRLPVAGYGTTEFAMSDARMDALYHAAYAAADAWCAAHPEG